MPVGTGTLGLLLSESVWQHPDTYLNDHCGEDAVNEQPAVVLSGTSATAWLHSGCFTSPLFSTAKLYTVFLAFLCLHVARKDFFLGRRPRRLEQLFLAHLKRPISEPVEGV
jgi:hypothetical protein